ncbi:peptidoglycan-binding protein [Lewinella sp. IMCC34183]|uniref:peptidoglycan-binding protein n=1 Tax=Lewinella sp. IMCC34183 TaxID=2248762 RepID=UPI0013007EA0|nr:peptidoglycan-binding protein [Lewinella sp. IMCC34183]
MLRLLFLLLLPLLPAAAAAQALYNVRVGTFQDVKADDFTELRELGFVYGQARDGQLTDVYLGNYSSRERADAVTDELKEKGFRNAAPFAVPVGDTGEAAFIQIALRGRNRNLDWTALERAGSLFVDAADGVTKVVTGPYATTEAANAALPAVRGLGYTDAFVRTIPKGSLIPAGTFETGIKKPLIPISLDKVPPPAPAPPPAPSPAPARADSATAPAPPPPPTTRPAPTPPAEPLGEEAVAAAESRPAPLRAAAPNLPEIDGRTKRHSAAELQRVLKEKGYYTGSIDGYYGPGTQAAYDRAWRDMSELKKYQLLADARPVGGSVLAWPGVRLATTISDDLAAGTGNADRARTLANARPALLAATAPLPAAAATQARDWENTVWESLGAWATEDPLHARILSAFRVAYYQSQVRLEAMYQDRGLAPIAARDLATAALQNLLAADLERFR